MDADLCLPGGPYKSTIIWTQEERTFACLEGHHPWHGHHRQVTRKT